jgi:2-oxoglutarate ferredoxin oxidoreductase subunit beta
MNTYGMHTIHGRAAAVASGLKISRPDLSVWVITGDGDSLSIGGNHLIHALRRNVDMNILLFNNEIYGLTKGQYSPTSKEGSVTKSTPFGSLDHPFNPLSLALGADSGFIARAMDRDPKHMHTTILRAAAHKGTSLLEIYQNCIVFNDGAFDIYTDKVSRPETALYLEQGKPLVFGANQSKGIRLDGMRPEVVDLGNGFSADDLWIHDEKDHMKAYLLTRFFAVGNSDGLPRPFGVLYDVERASYEQQVADQMAYARKRNGEADLESLLSGDETWVVV